MELKSISSKIYNVIWGQCSNKVQEAIEYQKEFDDKDEKRDIVRKETAGTGSLENIRANLMKAIKSVFNLIQDDNEGEDSYLTRVKTNDKALESTGGKHILVSPDSVESTSGISTSQEDEIESE